MLAIEDLRSRDEISNIKKSLNANVVFPSDGLLDVITKLLFFSNLDSITALEDLIASENDDRGYIYFVNLIKTFVILLSLFIFIILKENTIYELFEFNLFFNSKIFEYCLLLTLCYFVISFFLKNNSQYNQTIKYYIKKDVLILVISNILIFIYMFLSKKFVFDNILNHTLLNLFILINLFLLNLYFNYLYNFLIRKNIIQRNIMLVGSYQEIKKILRSNLDNIYIFKCCIITDIKNQKLRLVKSEIKFPIFSEHDDIRTILEYHHLGQIWILNADKHNKKYISKFLNIQLIL